MAVRVLHFFCPNAVASLPASITTPTTIQLSGQGEGQNFCPNAVASLPASITFSVQQSGNAAVQGQFEVIVHLPSGNFFTKMGTLDSVQISGSSFTFKDHNSILYY